MIGIGQTPTPCPRCGAPNRAGAKFCSQCRAPLAIAAPTKVCPNCHTPNRTDAKFCTKCRHVFVNAPTIPRSVIFVGVGLASLFGLVIVCGLLVLALRAMPPSSVAGVGTSTPTLTSTATALPTILVRTTEAPSPMPQTATPTVMPTSAPPVVLPSPTTAPSVDALERAERATVQISVPVDSRPGYASFGSGTIITKRGHILTNNHIFVDKNGKPENARGEIYIGFPPPENMKDKVQIRYRATIVQVDTKNDLALIRISALRDNRALPADLGLTVAPIGDSDAAKIGDAVFVLGFPGIGGDSLTFTRGVISGFLLDEGFIKTDAEINQGNSGGGAYNALYQLIGVPSQLVASRQSVGKVGLIRPIKTAKPLIDLAKREAGE